MKGGWGREGKREREREGIRQLCRFKTRKVKDKTSAIVDSYKFHHKKICERCAWHWKLFSTCYYYHYHHRRRRRKRWRMCSNKRKRKFFFHRRGVRGAGIFNWFDVRSCEFVRKKTNKFFFGLFVCRFLTVLVSWRTSLFVYLFVCCLFDIL